MNTAVECDSDLIEYYYLQQHMSGDQVAAKLGLSQYQVKKYLRENGMARTRKEATSKAAHTLKQKAANSALSAYDMQELRECRVSTLALSLMHKPMQSYLSALPIQNYAYRASSMKKLESC
jgi:predicted transcriptional regulator